MMNIQFILQSQVQPDTYDGFTVPTLPYVGEIEALWMLLGSPVVLQMFYWFLLSKGVLQRFLNGFISDTRHTKDWNFHIGFYVLLHS